MALGLGFSEIAAGENIRSLFPGVLACAQQGALSGGVGQGVQVQFLAPDYRPAGEAEAAGAPVHSRALQFRICSELWAGREGAPV